MHRCCSQLFSSLEPYAFSNFFLISIHIILGLFIYTFILGFIFTLCSRDGRTTRGAFYDGRIKSVAGQCNRIYILVIKSSLVRGATS